MKNNNIEAIDGTKKKLLNVHTKAGVIVLS